MYHEADTHSRKSGRSEPFPERGAKLARFAAGSGSRPVSASLEDASQLEPLLLLFCCHIVKQAVDTAKVGAGAAIEAAIGRRSTLPAALPWLSGREHRPQGRVLPCVPSHTPGEPWSRGSRLLLGCRSQL